MSKKILSNLLPLLMLSHVAQAEIKLVAIGFIPAYYQDLSKKTAAPLENGVAGNILGGLGSGLAYAGGNTFIALPDRGPNAVDYDATVDNTTSYINRFQTLDLSLAVNPRYKVGTKVMPFILSPQLTATTLLSSTTALSYGSKTPTGNTSNKFYYTGRSDGFKAGANSINEAHARFDPEGIRVANDGKSVFISDEYGPYVRQFNRLNGRLIKAFPLPSRFAVTNLRAMEADDLTPGNGEIAANTSGRTSNKGMEGLSITPDGKTLVGIVQANLIQDTKKYIRIVTIDIATGITHQYAYLLTDGSGASEILAINNHEFLVLERDGKGLGDESLAVVKKLFKIDLATATDVSNVDHLDATTPIVNKTLFLDIVEQLTANGIDAAQIPAKFEGIAFGSDVKVANKVKHTLYIANDNDFLPIVKAPVAGVSKPVFNHNKFFVFTFDAVDLPNLILQKIQPLPIDERHDRG